MLIHNPEKTTLCAQLLDESICVLDEQAFFFLNETSIWNTEGSILVIKDHM